MEVYKQLRIVLEQTNEKLIDNYLSTLCERLHNSIVNVFQIILIGTGYHVKRNGVIITEWPSVLILTCFARLYIAFLNTHT